MAVVNIIIKGTDQAKEAFKSATDSMVELASKGTDLSGALELAGKGFDLFKEGLEKVKDGMVDSVGKAADFETALNNIQNNTTLTNADMGTLSDGIKKLASESNVPLDDLGKGFMKVTNFGFSAKDATGILEEAMKSASSTGGDTAKTAELLASNMHMFGANAADAGKYMDVLHLASAEGNTTLEQFTNASGKAYAMSAQMGVSFNDTSAALAAMTRQGVNANEATTRFDAVLSKLIHPSKKAQEEIAALSKTTGIDLVKDFSEAGIQSKGFTQIMEDVKKATGGNADVMMKLFPEIRSFQGVMALTTTGAKDYHDILGQLNEVMAGQLTPTNDAFARTQNTLGFQLKELGNNIDLVMIKLGDALMPIVKQVTQTFIEMAKGALNGTGQFGFLQGILTSVTNTISKVVSAISEQFTPVIKEAGQVLSDVVVPIIGSLSEFLLQDVIPTFLKVGSAVVGAVLPPLAALASFTQTEVLPALNAIWAAFDKNILPVIVNVAQVLTSNLMPIIANLTRTFLEMFQGMANDSGPFGFLNNLFREFSNVVTVVALLIENKLAPILSDVGQIIGGVIIPIVQSLVMTFQENVAPAISKVISVFDTQVMPVLQKVGAFIADPLIPVIGKLAQFFLEKVVPTVMKVASAVVEALLPVFSQIVKFIGDVILPKLNDFWSFLDANVIPVVIKLANMIGQVLQRAFEIAGPIISKVMDVVGTAFTIAWNIISTVLGNLDVILGSIANVFIAFGRVIGAVWDGITGAISFAWNTIQTYVLSPIQAALNIVGGWFSALGDTVRRIWDGITGALSGGANFIKHIFEGAVNFIIDFINIPLKVINGIIDTIKSSVIGGLFGWASDIPLIGHIALAQGGITTGPTNALIGEAGQEAVLPLAQIVPLFSDAMTLAIDKNSRPGNGRVSGREAQHNPVAAAAEGNVYNYTINANYKYQERDNAARDLKMLQMLNSRT